MTLGSTPSSVIFSTERDRFDFDIGRSLRHTRAPVPGQEFVDAADQIGEIGIGVHAIDHPCQWSQTTCGSKERHALRRPLSLPGLKAGVSHGGPDEVLALHADFQGLATVDVLLIVYYHLCAFIMRLTTWASLS